jgi:hypothetical protein
MFSEDAERPSRLPFMPGIRLKLRWHSLKEIGISGSLFPPQEGASLLSNGLARDQKRRGNGYATCNQQETGHSE